MPSSFDYYGPDPNNAFRNNQANQQPQYGYPYPPQQYPYQSVIQQQAVPKSPVQDIKPAIDNPTIDIGGFDFPTVGDPGAEKMVIDKDESIEKPKSTRGRKKASSPVEINDSDINRTVEGQEVVENAPTINSYFQTATMLKNTMDQIDMVSSEIKMELDSVRNSRTMKGKYNVMVGLAGNLSDLLEAKVGAIKELNNCITKSNDMDYKIRKDAQDAQIGANDNKSVMDLYRYIVSSQNGFTQPDQSVPAPQQGTLMIDRGTDDSYNPNQMNQGYYQYMANITPEQSAMLYENNPDIKQCVIYDATTGAKWFQIMNVKTGQPIPGAQPLDQMFMEDTSIDLTHKIAKNNNLNETYPVIIMNDPNNVLKEY